MSKKIPPLLIETKSDNSNYFFLSVLEYKKESYLVVVDNVTNNEICAYVLDMAEAEKIDAQWFLNVCLQWYYGGSDRYPVSFEFNKIGAAGKVAPLLKTFKIDYVTRLIGEVFQYDMYSKPKVRRKKISQIPSTPELELKKAKGNVIDLLSNFDY